MNVTLDWVPVDGNEQVLRNKMSGRIVEFTNDPVAPEQEVPVLGLIDFFAEEDIPELFKRWTEY